MTRKELISHIDTKQSVLCVGLDTDINRIPDHLRKEKDPIFEFNRQIIDHTVDYAVAYKPNLAFYEAEGSYGWEALERTLQYIPKDIFIIADAKRGDIGNTSSAYARAFFEKLNCDAITVAPYMGEDSVKPFLNFENKWVVLLALTSNKGGDDFQQLILRDNGDRLYEKVLEISREWGSPENLMYVVGATKAQYLKDIRKVIPDHFLLVPGVGAQGGDLRSVCEFGLNKDYGLLINSSRSIIYADNGRRFAEKAGQVASSLSKEMQHYLSLYMSS